MHGEAAFAASFGLYVCTWSQWRTTQCVEKFAELRLEGSWTSCLMTAS